MTQLTQQEIEMIEREAGTQYPFGSSSSNTTVTLRRGYKSAATKYLTQLKEERERAGKLLDALEEIRKVYPDKSWLCGRAEKSITEYKNNNPTSSPSEK